ELAIERLGGATLERDGEQRAVALYAIHGISTQPNFLWLDDDDRRGFFGFVYPGYMLVAPSGWTEAADALDALKKVAEANLLEARAPRLAHRLGDELVIRNARVFDTDTGALTAPKDVYVHDGRIAALYPAGSQQSG